MSVAALAAPVLRGRVLITRLALLGALCGAAFALTRARTYSSAVAFMPQTPRSGSAGGAAALASQFGISLGSAGDPSQSPQFYLDLMTSRTILEPLVAARYRVGGPGGAAREATLMDLFRLPAELPGPVRVAAAVDRAADALTTTVARTGVIRVTVRAPTPEVATQVADRLVALLDGFNRHTRQTQAAAERRFAEARLGEVRGELRRAENALQYFLQTNREYAFSPTLTAERARLDRDLVLQQQRYLGLVQAYEQARLEEVRDTPLLTVVEPPSRPLQADSRDGLRLLLLGGVVGALLGVLVAWARAAGAAAVDADGPSGELRRLWPAFTRDLRRPWRLLWPARGA